MSNHFMELKRRKLSSLFADKKYGFNMMKSIGVVVACLMIFPVFFIVFVVYGDKPLDQFKGFAEAARVIDVNLPKGAEGASSKFDIKDKLLDGLLTSGFDEMSCLSRYQSFLYRKSSPRKPSEYLKSRLRKYEDLHKKCGPYTESYNRTVKKLISGHHIGPDDCSYIVWVAYSGLGNRIITLASTFLYALLTDRVLLVDRGTDMDDLFCEPFPETSWLLPLDFPLKKLNNIDQNSPEWYGNMLIRNAINYTMESQSLPPFLHLYLVHDYDDQHKAFFCDQDQSLLRKIPWLIVKTNNYFVPYLFLMSSFEQELLNLFPSKDMVFHHLGRYLFHPSNAVWGLITRYYKAHMAHADERVGIQIRSFDTGTQPFQYVLDQVIACFLKEGLLPEVQSFDLTASEKWKSKAVLITSLNAGYFVKIKAMYWENPSVTGEVIGVLQPSHEEIQQTDEKNHDRKAWAEMYLLSLTDVLVTSAWSTFGYVAQGLGGIKPWILYKPENRTTPDPPCRRAMSMEPCFHCPPFYDCNRNAGVNTGKLVPHVRHCEDMTKGLKLVGREEL